MINRFAVYEASLHHLNNKPVMLFTITQYVALFCRTFNSLGMVVISYRLIRLTGISASNCVS